MSFRRLGRLAAMVIPTLLCLSCGQVYRPVVIPCSAGGGIPNCPVITPPTPANFHAVFAISNNLPGNTGGAMQIDVAGDSIIAENPPTDSKFGENPTHAAILPNNSRLFVASAGSATGGVDVVAAFAPAFQSFSTPAFGPITAISLPSQSAGIASISEAGSLVTVTLNAPLNVTAGYNIVIAGVVIPNCVLPACNPLAYNGAFSVSSIDPTGTIITFMNSASGLPAPLSGGTATFPPQPVFLNSTQNSAMYVANYNYNSVSVINASQNAVTNTAPVGVHPVALAETPNGNKIYVANQGDNTVSSLNVANLSSNAVTGFSGVAPVWLVARADSQKVYVLTEGDGKLVTVDTASDTAATPDCAVTPTLCVGAGANFILYDPHLNRLYVTNPETSMVYVFSDTGGAGDTPVLLKQISFAANSTPCPAGCSPTSVTALPDGSRFYVASYQLSNGSCPDSTVTGSCIVPGLTVFDANSLTPKITPALSLLAFPFAAGQFAVPLAASCASPVYPALYAPNVTRFRVFTVASVDSSHVYVSMCDAGAVADINTTNNNTNGSGGGTPADTLTADLPVAYEANSVALITAFSITSNIATFQAANGFVPGQTVSISGLTTGNYLNGLTLTVLATGLSGSQFECDFTHADVGLTTDSGTALRPLPSLQSPVFLLTGQ
jgi:YVTN family beta-propeller protein